MIQENALKNFGAWLQAEREDRDISRSVVVKALGYTNINKGCRRLVAWERGKEDIEPKYFEALIEVIGISPEEWAHQRQILDSEKARAKTYQSASSEVSGQMTRLIVEHIELLMAHAERIADSPRWHHIRVHGIKFGMMYFGGASVQLGALIGAWAAGELQVDTEEGPVWIYSGGCSPLSGWNSLWGFNIRSKKHGHYSNIFQSASDPIHRMMKRCKAASAGFSALSLPQLLVELGVAIPSVTLSLHGEAWAEYDFQSSTLTIGDEAVEFDFSLVDSDPLSRPPVATETVWGNTRHGGRPVIGNLLTGQLGAYVGEEWTVDTAAGAWTLKAGQLVNPAGIPVLSWSSDIPPLVQIWLAERLAQMQV